MSSSGDVGRAAKEAELSDETGVVQAWEFTSDVELSEGSDFGYLADAAAEFAGANEAWLVETDTPWDLRLVWSALPCQTAPTLSVETTDGEISVIRLDPGPVVSPDSEHPGCEDMEVRHAIDMRTSEPLAAKPEIVVDTPKK